ncbi:patatin-like phospholipase family protein [Vallitalea okinawensis]|uniref:patatin-like phospholipase family protein n=1 Tax=Vallitalea okinawensis TaxID=2078660 RepID=UPI000CFC901F|nr:patatin family protein [Vallitalea okinawensis]
MDLNHQKVGLVLEGGGTRGIFAAGVLDYFLEREIHLPYIIGVSMGAFIGQSYVSKQKGRARDICTKYVNDPRYMSIRNFIKEKSLFGFDFLLNDIQNQLIPLDYGSFSDSDQQFQVVALDCLSGEPVYLDKSNCPDFNIALRASCSLPIVTPTVNYRNHTLLDGGIIESIPFKKALDDGMDKLVVIVTRDKNFRKKPIKHGFIAKGIYRKYPSLVQKLYNWHSNYNNMVEKLNQLELEGKAFVIRPEEPPKVKRLDMNKEKLAELYQWGYNMAIKQEKSLLEFLSKQ